MKRLNIYLPVTALILAALAVPAAAQSLIPFNGAMQGREIDMPQGGPPYHIIGRWKHPGNCYLSRSILIHLSTYGDPCKRHRSRVWSIDRCQWGQHLYYDCGPGSADGFTRR